MDSLKHLKLRPVLALLKKYYPKATCALHYNSPVQLLVATILSAQCTDKRVNEVTKTLFKKYQTAKDFALAPLKELEKHIYSTGFFRAKALNIQLACQKIQKDFGGILPRDLPKLLNLPGVGRKTAHVVLGQGFGIPSGVVVDTHVKRLSYRLGLTLSKDPKKIEKDLCLALDQKDWIYFSHALILHGREVCKSQKPKCQTCFLQELCPQKGVVVKGQRPGKGITSPSRR